MITNALDLPVSLQEYAKDALKPGQFVHWYISDSNTLTYGELGKDTDLLTAHHDYASGLFYAKGWNTGKLYTWHGKRVDGSEFGPSKADRTNQVRKPHITQDFDQMYS